MREFWYPTAGILNELFTLDIIGESQFLTQQAFCQSLFGEKGTWLQCSEAVLTSSQNDFKLNVESYVMTNGPSPDDVLKATQKKEFSNEERVDMGIASSRQRNQPSGGDEGPKDPERGETGPRSGA